MTANQFVEVAAGYLNMGSRSYSSSTYALTTSGVAFAPSMDRAESTIRIDSSFAAYHGKRGFLHEGTVLYLNAHSSIGGTLNEFGAVLLRLRGDAPMIQVAVRLPPSSRTPHEVIYAFRGRADILSADEVEAFGYAISETHTERAGRIDDIAALYDIVESAPGMSVPVAHTVVTEAGVKTVVRTTTRVRRRRFSAG